MKLSLPPLIACGLTVLLSACGAPPSGSESVGSASEAICTESYDWHDFPNGDQCVGAVEGFFHAHFDVGLPPLCGYPTADGCDSCGACELWVGNAPDPSTWVRMATGTPQLFDLIVYPPPNSSNPYGHVAVVDHVDSTTVYVMDDNYVGALEKASCPHTVSWAPYGWYRLKTLENHPPQGSLDSVTCTAISGWTYDPDTPSQAIYADAYFDGASGSGAQSLQWLANGDRPDLCTAIGSCDHGFVIPTPIGLMDGDPHTVFLYGIDSSGDGDNPLLGGSPKTFTCAPPELPFAPAIKRHVPDPTVLAAWHLQPLTDVAHFTDAEVAAIPNGPDTPDAPSLVEADFEGKTAVFIVDGAELRHVQNPASVTAWHFDPSTLVVNPPPQIATLPQGLPWPETPFFVQSTTAVYMIDLTTPPAPAPDAGTPVDAAAPGPADAAVKVDAGRKIDPGLAPGASAADASDDGNLDPEPTAAGASAGPPGGCALSRGAPPPGSGALLLLGGVALAARRRRVRGVERRT